MNKMTKVYVHLKTGQKLSYYSTQSPADLKHWWRQALGNDGVQFGRFAMQVSNIAYVEVVE